MNIEWRKKEIMNLHTEYESMTKLFRFAVEKAETEEDKKKFQFQLKICQSMTVVLALLLDILEERRRKKP